MTVVKPPTPLRPAPSLTKSDMMKQAQAIKTQIQENTGLLSKIAAKQAEQLEKKKALKEKKEKEELRKLKQLAKKCAIKKGERAEKSVTKLVKGVLGERFDSRSRGFNQMVEDISDFINNHDELKKDFHHIVGEMQAQV